MEFFKTNRSVPKTFSFAHLSFKTKVHFCTLEQLNKYIPCLYLGFRHLFNQPHYIYLKNKLYTIQKHLNADLAIKQISIFLSFVVCFMNKQYVSFYFYSSALNYLRNNNVMSIFAGCSCVRVNVVNGANNKTSPEKLNYIPVAYKSLCSTSKCIFYTHKGVCVCATATTDIDKQVICQFFCSLISAANQI